LTPEQQINRGQKAQEALLVLDEAFDAVISDYRERLCAVAVAEPWAADKLRALALAQKIAEGARAHIEAMVAQGTVGKHAVENLRKIEAMSPQRRRILGL
jgi:hypothetical protein